MSGRAQLSTVFDVYLEAYHWFSRPPELLIYVHAKCQIIGVGGTSQCAMPRHKLKPPDTEPDVPANVPMDLLTV